MKIEIHPIGMVANNILYRGHIEAGDIISEINIYENYADALDEIEDFSHLIIIYWMDRISAEERRILKVHPRHNLSLPLRGVFSTRSPARPNPIGITTVNLIEKRGCKLLVSGLDALNGTPVLDIKPYIPDKIDLSQLKIPDWAESI